MASASLAARMRSARSTSSLLHRTDRMVIDAGQGAEIVAAIIDHQLLHRGRRQAGRRSAARSKESASSGRALRSSCATGCRARRLLTSSGEAAARPGHGQRTNDCETLGRFDRHRGGRRAGPHERANLSRRFARHRGDQVAGRRIPIELTHTTSRSRARRPTMCCVELGSPPQSSANAMIPRGMRHSTSLRMTLAGTPPARTFGRQVAGHDAASCDNRTLADRHAGGDRGACPEPDVVLEHDVADLVLGIRQSGRPRLCIERMSWIAREERAPRNSNIVAKADGPADCDRRLPSNAAVPADMKFRRLGSRGPAGDRDGTKDMAVIADGDLHRAQDERDGLEIEPRRRLRQTRLEKRRPPENSLRGEKHRPARNQAEIDRLVQPRDDRKRRVARSHHRAIDRIGDRMAAVLDPPPQGERRAHSTVTDFARLRGRSMSYPRATAT